MGMKLAQAEIEQMIGELERLLHDDSVEVVAVTVVVEGGGTVYYTIERTPRNPNYFVLLNEDRGVVDVYPLSDLSAGEIFDALIETVEEASGCEVVRIHFEKDKRIY
jgi:hypothetical protein